MKYYILAAIVIVFVVILFDLPSKSQKYVEEASKQFDPARSELQQGFNSYVKMAWTKEGVEFGYIYLTNGDKVKYWFLSHHLSGDLGSTLFEFSDGERVYMDGGFCCEVQLPEKQLRDRQELEEVIKAYDDTTP